MSQTFDSITKPLELTYSLAQRYGCNFKILDLAQVSRLKADLLDVIAFGFHNGEHVVKLNHWHIILTFTK